ncbi:P-loop NTPase family protein [Pseudomonas mucidolens]|uniref:Adenylate kinase n=1 Tax=Pseudomonas mucidolens TaxID=46679 RepID=A0A1H2MJ91_9PSED|nr:AAA family ATPase [Pseudomonas mucidolens]SDU93323.1 Adenylate kinase [Pseudomonas mucidolens]SQH33749.1 kinase [Pseudomonas mucidolens]
MIQRIYLTGASGAGVTTLGKALASALQLPHVDVDDYYWYPTDPPYVQSRPAGDRVVLLKQALVHGHWVLSGSLDGWGDELIVDAQQVVLVDTPTPLRIERLKDREVLRFGERVAPGGDMHAAHLAFLAWAAGYDRGAFAGRSRPRHEAWFKQLKQPSLRVDGSRCVEALLQQVHSSLP